MSKKPPHPYYTPPPSPPRKPATSGRGVDEDWRRERRRVSDQIRGAIWPLFDKYELLENKSNAMDKEIDRLYTELLNMMVDFYFAESTGDITRARSLIPGIKKLANELLRKLADAYEFNKQVYREWPSLCDEVKKKIEDIIAASGLPEDIRNRILKHYRWVLEHFEPPTSAYGDLPHLRNEIERYLEAVRKLEKSF